MIMLAWLRVSCRYSFNDRFANRSVCNLHLKILQNGRELHQNQHCLSTNFINLVMRSSPPPHHHHHLTGWPNYLNIIGWADEIQITIILILSRGALSKCLRLPAFLCDRWLKYEKNYHYIVVLFPHSSAMQCSEECLKLLPLPLAQLHPSFSWRWRW